MNCVRVMLRMSALNLWKIVKLKFPYFYTVGMITPKHLIFILRDLIIFAHISFLYFYLDWRCWFRATNNIKWWIQRQADNYENLELLLFSAKYVQTSLNSMEIEEENTLRYHAIGYALRFIFGAREKCVVWKSNELAAWQPVSSDLWINFMTFVLTSFFIWLCMAVYAMQYTLHSMGWNSYALK